MDSRLAVKLAYEALDDKKANNIKIINIGNISSMSDYFIIADGANRNQVQAMCDNIEEVFHKNNISLKNREGYSDGGWILLDYYDIIIHIFSHEEREFYDLEHIWRDGEIVSVDNL